ncbi:MAG: exonuclease domain-containing protein [Planctomycetota bacterium]
MSFAANFTAIDFETATNKRDSACQLGAVKVRDGHIVDEAMWMIRPKPLRFSPGNIRIHGITPQMVRDESDFGELWPEISRTLGDDCLIAHNASFDMGVLLACLRSHDQETPDIGFSCTKVIARRAWPHQRRFGLKPLSQWLGIRFKHHDALEDSLACAKILIAAGQDSQAESLEDLESKLALTRGRAGVWGYRSPTGRRSRAKASGLSGQHISALDVIGSAMASSIGSSQVNEGHEAYQAGNAPRISNEVHIDLQRILIRGEFRQPLRGMSIAVAGTFDTIDVKDADRVIGKLGGQTAASLTNQTSVLVLGKKKRGTTSEHCEVTSMLEKAEAINADGGSIRVLSEAEFLEWIGSSPVGHRAASARG